MSVPYAPPGYVDILSALEKLGIDNFYLQYFQKPGVAEAELQQDIRGALRKLYFTAGGEMAEKDKGFGRLTGGTLLANTVDPETLPAWLSDADLDYCTAEFARAGFRGGLNWYRNLRRNWELSGPWRGQPIRQPSQFIAGSRDGVLRFPAAKSQLEAYPKTLPGLRGSHILEGAGHWVQQERAAEVNRLLIDFLKGLERDDHACCRSDPRDPRPRAAGRLCPAAGAAFGDGARPGGPPARPRAGLSPGHRRRIGRRWARCFLGVDRDDRQRPVPDGAGEHARQCGPRRGRRGGRFRLDATAEAREALAGMA